MASTYSTNLRLELIGTGEQQGTWGTTTNTNLGTLLEEAIGGYVSVTVSDVGDTTLTTANGAVDQARNMTLNLTGTISAARNVIVPAIEKIYVIKNATSGGYAVTVKVSGQTGVSIPNGTTMLVFVDGTDVRQANIPVSSSGAGIISVTDNSNAALRITQLGTGEAIRVEDSTNPDSTPFIVDASGRVGVGTASPTVPLQVASASTASSPLVLVTTGQTGTTVRSNTALRIQSEATGRDVGLQFSDNITNSTEIGMVSGSQYFCTSGSERMRIDASGNVGIGISSPVYKLDVSGGSIRNSGDLLMSSSSYVYSYSGGSTGQVRSGINFDGSGQTMSLFTAQGERMRIDSSGNVGIGTSSPSAILHVANTENKTKAYITGYGDLYGVGLDMRPAVNDASPISFQNSSGTVVGSIRTSSSGTAYNTSSDRRLKMNFDAITGASSTIMELKPYTFEFIAEPGTRVPGFIADEVQQVVPLAVTGEKDAVDKDGTPIYQGIDQSKLVPLLTAALQEALTKIDALEARIAALEGA